MFHVLLIKKSWSFLLIAFKWIKGQMSFMCITDKLRKKEKMVNNKNKTQQTHKFFLNKCLNVNSFSDYLQKMQPQFQWKTGWVWATHQWSILFSLWYIKLTKTAFTRSNQVNCPKQDKLNKLPPSCCFIAPLNRSIYVLTKSCNS